MQVWYIEHGIRKLKPKWAEEIAKALNCSVSDLLSETQNEIFEEDEFLNLSEEEKNLIRTFRKIKEEENNKTAKAE